MIRSWKNKEFTSSLSNQELKEFYGCLAHHTRNPHTKRKNCCDDSTKFHEQSEFSCNKSNDHFCTSNSIGYIYPIGSKCDDTFNDSLVHSNSFQKHENSIIVCEDYRPSYTSKKDQIQFLKQEVGALRKSKSMMQKAMDDLDRLLEESQNEKNDKDASEMTNMDSVERFYRSKEFIGSSMNIRSLNEYVPRNDIIRNCYEVEERDLKDKREPLLATPLFGFFNKDIFTDRQILENELFRKNYGRKVLDPSFKLKPKSAIIYRRKK